MQPGPANTIVAVTLHSDTPETYSKVRAVLELYGFRDSVDNHAGWPIYLPEHSWLGARIDHVDALRDLLRAKMVEQGIEVKALLVARISEWAMSGPCFY